MRRFAQKTRKATIGLICTVIFGGLLAQGQSPWGKLRGVVRDASGARIAAAAISVRRLDSGEQRRAKSDSRGEFQIGDLKPGVYRIQVSSAGFAEAQSDVNVLVSATQEVAVVLQPVRGHETITVRGTASSVTLQPL